MVHSLLTDRRVLGRGNAQSGAIGADFGRLGLDLWPSLRLRDPRNARRQDCLDQLNVWRNAVAHRDFVFNPAQATLAENSACSLRWVRIWRRNCSALARQLDIEVNRHLRQMTGRQPW